LEANIDSNNPLNQDDGQLHPVLASIRDIIPALAEAIGSDSEVLLHDLSRLPRSIVGIGGNVTGRQVGGPMTDLLAKLIRQGQSEHVRNYHTVLPDGRVLRCSTLFLKDHNNVPVGCLCVNTDISGWQEAADLVAGRLGPKNSTEGKRGQAESSDEGVDEFFVSNVEDLQKTMVEKAIDSIEVPLQLMTKHHKVKVVQVLEESGFFLIRDSAEYLAQAIGVTRYTIYNYLNQLRVSTKFPE